MRSKVKLNEKSDKMSLNAINTSYYSVPRSCMCICFLSVSGIGSLLFCGFEMATDTHLQVCFIVSVKIITDIIGFIVWHPNLFNFFQLAAGGPKICVAGLVFPFFFFFFHFDDGNSIMIQSDSSSNGKLLACRSCEKN